MKYLNGVLALLLVLGVSLGAVACKSAEEEEHHDPDGDVGLDTVYHEHVTLVGLQCPTNCVGAVDAALRDKVHGVVDVNIDFQGIDGSPTVIDSDRPLSREEIQEAVAGLELGFEVVFPEDAAEEEEHEDEDTTDESDEDEETSDDEEDDEHTEEQEEDVSDE